jgi:hypothetical protein
MLRLRNSPLPSAKPHYYWAILDGLCRHIGLVSRSPWFLKRKCKHPHKRLRFGLHTVSRAAAIKLEIAIWGSLLRPVTQESSMYSGALAMKPSLVKVAWVLFFLMIHHLILLSSYSCQIRVARSQEMCPNSKYIHPTLLIYRLFKWPRSHGKIDILNL